VLLFEAEFIPFSFMVVFFSFFFCSSFLGVFFFPFGGLNLLFFVFFFFLRIPCIQVFIYFSRRRFPFCDPFSRGPWDGILSGSVFHVREFFFRLLFRSPPPPFPTSPSKPHPSPLPFFQHPFSFRLVSLFSSMENTTVGTFACGSRSWTEMPFHSVFSFWPVELCSPGGASRRGVSGPPLWWMCMVFSTDREPLFKDTRPPSENFPFFYFVSKSPFFLSGMFFLPFSRTYPF